MWQPFQASRLAKSVETIAASSDFSQRIEPLSGGHLGEIALAVNSILEKAEARDRQLRKKLEELTDARDDAQTANQLMRRLKNELKARSIERDAALRRAEAANEAKSQFLANVCHEIRTPMHGILGLADVLARSNLEARQQSLVQTLLRSGRGLLAVINDVLDFSKIESGRFDLAPRPFSLKLAVEEVVEPLRPRFEAKGVELIVRVEKDLPDVLVGDVIRIKQVLTNLVENGLKFTDAGYVILDVGGELTGNLVELVMCVQDTGIGIPKDKLEAVFEKFNQVDNSSTRRHQGTGLGLAISRMLSEMMGGTIEVASTLGQGTAFTVKLPLPVHEPSMISTSMGRTTAAIAAAAPSAQTVGLQVADDNIVPLGGGKFQRARVLLVEDNCVNQEVAIEYLNELGCHVTSALNGREAIAHFSGDMFDLVLMDCLMPDVDGLQATRAIREIELRGGRPRTPVVALTANAFDHDRDGCLSAGMDDFQSKPFSFDELKSVVRRWLPDRFEAAGAAAQA